MLNRYTNEFNEYINSKSNPFIIPQKDYERLVNMGIGEFYKELFEEKLKSVFNINNLDELIK